MTKRLTQNFQQKIKTRQNLTPNMNLNKKRLTQNFGFRFLLPFRARFQDVCDLRGQLHAQHVGQRAAQRLQVGSIGLLVVSLQRGQVLKSEARRL